MAKTREQMQDIALGQMDKVNRRTRGQRDSTPVSLAEQIKAAEKLDNMTPAERRASLSWDEWRHYFNRFLIENSFRYPVAQDSITWAYRRYGKVLEEFHQTGETWQVAAQWLVDKQTEHINL
jgi:hypothetical protein